MPDERASKTTQRAAVTIAVILSFAALFAGSEFFIPVALGFVYVALLWPLVSRLERWRIPSAVGAALCVFGTVGLLGAAVASFQEPMQKFVDDLPRTIRQARPKLEAVSASISKIVGGTVNSPTPKKSNRAATPNRISVPDSAKANSDSVKSADSAKSNVDTASGKSDSSQSRADSTSAKGDSGKSKPSTPAASTNKDKPVDLTAISNGAPVTISHALGIASSLLGEFIEVVLFAMFVLAGGQMWKKKIIEVTPDKSRQEAIISTVDEVRSVVSRYILVTTLINIGQAAVIGLLLELLGYPSPLLWGVLTFALEFIPYFGGLVVVALLLVVGLAAGRDFPAALYGPGVYLAVTSLQNNVLSPIVYGRGMRLNPTAILAGLVFWYMIWGVAGAFLAVPILAAISVVSSHIPQLKGLHAFLSD